MVCGINTDAQLKSHCTISCQQYLRPNIHVFIVNIILKLVIHRVIEIHCTNFKRLRKKLSKCNNIFTSRLLFIGLFQTIVYSVQVRNFSHLWKIIVHSIVPVTLDMLCNRCLAKKELKSRSGSQAVKFLRHTISN